VEAHTARLSPRLGNSTPGVQVGVCKLKGTGELLHVKQLSNGYSRTNLASASTRQKFTIFCLREYSPKWLFSEMCRTRQILQICQPVLLGLAKLADIRQPVLLGLAKLADIGKRFCEDLPDSRKASLASVTRIWQIWRVWRIWRV
jgi:hypothetical protein